MQNQDQNNNVNVPSKTKIYVYTEDPFEKQMEKEQQLIKEQTKEYNSNNNMVQQQQQYDKRKVTDFYIDMDQELKSLNKIYLDQSKTLIKYSKESNEIKNDNLASNNQKEIQKKEVNQDLNSNQNNEDLNYKIPVLSILNVQWEIRNAQGELINANFRKQRNRVKLFDENSKQIIGIHFCLRSMVEGETCWVEIPPIFQKGMLDTQLSVPQTSTLFYKLTLHEVKLPAVIKKNESIEEIFEETEDTCIKGNQLFKQQQYLAALKKYKKACGLVENIKKSLKEKMSEKQKKQRADFQLKYSNNGCVCNMKLQNFREAIQYAESALKVDESNFKALFNLSKCYLQLKMFEDAQQSLKKCVLVNEKDEAVLKLQKEVDKMLKQQKIKNKTKRALQGGFLNEKQWEKEEQRELIEKKVREQQKQQKLQEIQKKEQEHIDGILSKISTGWNFDEQDFYKDYSELHEQIKHDNDDNNSKQYQQKADEKTYINKNENNDQ